VIQYIALLASMLCANDGTSLTALLTLADCSMQPRSLSCAALCSAIDNKQLPIASAQSHCHCVSLLSL
jgi:hypothetical protein